MLDTVWFEMRAIVVATLVQLAGMSGPAHAQPPTAPPTVSGDALMDLLRQPGHVAFMRHALAPFEGAPKETGRTAEALGPCETQRNLDERGRADARRIGDAFRTAGVVFDRIYTSKWCRCRETAELIAGRPVENLPLINSYFTDPSKAQKGPAQLAALRAFLNHDLKPGDRVLMVTHGSLIHDLTEFVADESDIAVVKADGKGGIVVVASGKP
ncbi:MAG TPA: histidine phosphatase family protein [Hyphomicrobiaceae bacterium]|nr:histidine phosphatase family protein [Hyphomicrobiaceae bacterium]